MAKKIYNKRRRSKHSLAVDRGRTTKKVFPNTPTGRRKYKEYGGYADLKNYDTITRESQLNRWGRQKKSTYQFEKLKGDQDLIDMGALYDSQLTTRENKDNLRRLYRDNLR